MRTRAQPITTLHLEWNPAVTPPDLCQETATHQIASDRAPNIGKPFLQIRNQTGSIAFTAHPVLFVPGVYMMGVIEPGSHDPLGAPGIWANETDLKGEIDWLDDSVSGLCCRKIYEPKDVIGSKGEIAGVPYIFDAILQTGQNVIVYQLTNLDTCDYLAYGFGRTDFDARHALVQYLRHIVEGKRPYISGKVIALANWVLEAFPSDGIAIFNKGVAHIYDKNFSEAHRCFGLLVQEDPEYPLALVHDAAALAGMGEHAEAIQQLRRADRISEEELRNHLRSLEPLRRVLHASIHELIRSNPEQASVGDLWLKYFPPDIETEHNGTNKGAKHN